MKAAALRYGTHLRTPGAGAGTAATTILAHNCGGASSEGSAEGAVNEGIYVVRTDQGGYVGQSGNSDQRFAQHVASGKFTLAEVGEAKRIAVGGGRVAREIAEQLKSTKWAA